MSFTCNQSFQLTRELSTRPLETPRDLAPPPAVRPTSTEPRGLLEESAQLGEDVARAETGRLRQAEAGRRAHRAADVQEAERVEEGAARRLVAVAGDRWRAGRSEALRASWEARQ